MVTVYICEKTAYPLSESYIIDVLERFYGIPSPHVLKTENGKPYIEGNPIHFSLSHTKEKYFLAVSAKPIGIDAEKSDRIIDEAVAQRHFPSEEFPDNKSLLYKWLKTESKVKYLGSTLRDELSQPSTQEFFYSFHETGNHTVCVCYGEATGIQYIEL